MYVIASHFGFGYFFFVLFLVKKISRNAQKMMNDKVKLAHFLSCNSYGRLFLGEVGN